MNRHIQNFTYKFRKLDIDWRAVAILVAFMSMNLLPGRIAISILAANTGSFFAASIFLARVANLRHYREQKSHTMDFFRKSGDIASVMAVGVIGLPMSIYNIFVFYRNPLRKEYDSREQQERDRKLKSIGIKE